jgi:hypothetical protein
MWEKLKVDPKMTLSRSEETNTATMKTIGNRNRSVLWRKGRAVAVHTIKHVRTQCRSCRKSISERTHIAEERDVDVQSPSKRVQGVRENQDEERLRS